MRDSLLLALSDSSDFNDNTRFLHSSIIIEACQADTLINQNAMHILYFIITSFAYVEMIFMLLLLFHMLTHLSSPSSLSLSISRAFCVNIKWNFIFSTASTVIVQLSDSTSCIRFSFRKWNCNSFNRYWNTIHTYPLLVFRSSN